MTWKEFKDKVEAQGVQDDEDIIYIDLTGADDWSARYDASEAGWKLW